MNGLQPPYGIIRNELLKGRVIPFLGAGASLQPRDMDKVPWRTPANAARTRWSVSYIPSAPELAQHLADEAQFPDQQKELAKVAQYFGAVSGRDILCEMLNEIFDHDHPYTSLHTYLAGVAKNTPLLILTTNYDDLIERAFQDEGTPYDLVVHTSDPNLGENLLWWQHGQAEPQQELAKNITSDPDKVSVIYKMHGAVDRRRKQLEQYVITEDDYIDFLGRMINQSAIPDVFAEPLQSRRFLFLGYGLYDWNLRVVLSRIEKQFRRPNQRIKSWAIQLKPNPVEQKLWEGRNVEVFYQDIGQFVAALQGLAEGPPADAGAGDS